MSYLFALLASAVVLGVYLWSDGCHPSNDGARYTSSTPQPKPFHRRFHHWNPKALQVVTHMSLLGLGVAMGTPAKALMLLVLPGAWFIATRPHLVDAPAMLAAWLAALVLPQSALGSVALALVGGAIHERAPVFAALYAWSPWPLLGLLAVQWWAKPGPIDDDVYVGRDFKTTLLVHRHKQDLTNGQLVAASLRGALAFPLWYGAPLSVWVTLGVAYISRLLGTDGSRFMFWAAPALIAAVPASIPAWAVALHCLTFMRIAG